jgi:hypothetical protein
MPDQPAGDKGLSCAVDEQTPALDYEGPGLVLSRYPGYETDWCAVSV